MTKYRRIATFDAEQFDGSNEMIINYGVTSWSRHDGTDYAVETEQGLLHLKVGDWIIRRVSGLILIMDDHTFKQNYERAE